MPNHSINPDQLQFNLAGSCFPVKLGQTTSQVKKLAGIIDHLIAKAIKIRKVEYSGSNDNGTWIIESADKVGAGIVEFSVGGLEVPPSERRKNYEGKKYGI